MPASSSWVIFLMKAVSFLALGAGFAFVSSPVKASWSYPDTRSLPKILFLDGKPEKWIKRNEILVLKIAVSYMNDDSKDISLVGFDARMPEHNHGMVTKPKVIAQSDGKYQIKGVQFHMKGRWEVIFRLKTSSGDQTIVLPLDVP